MNVIFDFGQVLIRFEPEYMCEKYAATKEDVSLLSEVLFDRLYWDRLDAGTIEDEELLEEVKKRLPERLHVTAEKIYFNWIYNLPEITGMRDVIKLCKSKGYGVYLLSNISKFFANHYKEIPILQLVDGFVFSATAGCVKPSEQIFEHITNKFNLTPSQTLFVDDNITNVKGADKFGIIAYHFDGNARSLYSFIEKLA